MATKFNPKQYQGKNRVYPAVHGAVGICRVLIWDEIKSEYLPPVNGKCFLARRREAQPDGGTKRVPRYFETLSEARQWQSYCLTSSKSELRQESKGGPTLGEVVTEWQKRKWSSLSEGTKLQYERMLRKHFQALLSIPVLDITPRHIDSWIDELKANHSMQTKRRKAFDHELTLLGVILRYYNEYNDDTGFVLPIKQRHREAIVVSNDGATKNKDLTEEEFIKLREALKKGPHGDVMVALATVQYYQALRISEAAGLYWEDVTFDDDKPSNSRLSIVRYMVKENEGT